MKLTSATVGPFRSISTPQTLTFDPHVTVLVGQNEAGKSATLEALFSAKPVNGTTKFSVTEDYPRKDLNEYEAEHPDHNTQVVEISFALDEAEKTALAKRYGSAALETATITLFFHYNNTYTIRFSLNEGEALRYELSAAGLSDGLSAALREVRDYQQVEAASKDVDSTDHDKAFLHKLNERIVAMKKGSWAPRLASWEAYHEHLNSLIPQFLLFSEYNTLPGETNLADLQLRVAGGGPLTDADRAVIALLRMAGVSLETLTAGGPYEEATARLEGFSNRITDKVFKYWKQNQDLEVVFDVKTDPTAPAPFNNGPNLYIRIKNRRHRVTVSFSRRSRGFIWFFSFLVWFEDAQTQAGAKMPLILLLDEPGLSLHALAQADFLRFIDDLGKKHQVLYTTHSPFMIDPGGLDRVRVAEDRDNSGTTLSDRLDSQDPKSIFPLQAALGYTIAQNLFIAEKNVLVEGPADLLYLQAASSTLEGTGRAALADGTVVVPAGGLDKVATFVALLRGNALRFALCIDRGSSPDQRLDDLVNRKLLQAKAVLDFSMFRPAGGSEGTASDVEDMFLVPHYLDMFNHAYEQELKGRSVAETDLVAGPRIVVRLNQWLTQQKIALRKDGGFNHYLVANRAIAAGIAFDDIELAAFEALFARIAAVLG